MFEAIDWRVFFLLLGAGFLGSQSVLPLNRSIRESTGRHGKTRPWLVSSGIALVVVTVAVLGGLILSAHLRTVGTPLIESALRGTTVPNLWTAVTVPIVAGLGLGAILSPAVFYRPPDSRLEFFNIPIWKRLLAGLFHGGIVEELVFRWFLLSFFAWSLSIVPGLTADPVSSRTFWAANTISALLFGLMHLPGSAAIAPLTKMTIALTLFLNVIVGLVYGYLFWQSGLEAAVLAHMSTHIVLQPCASLLLRFRGNVAPSKALEPTSPLTRRGV